MAQSILINLTPDNNIKLAVDGVDHATALRMLHGAAGLLYNDIDDRVAAGTMTVPVDALTVEDATANLVTACTRDAETGVPNG